MQMPRFLHAVAIITGVLLTASESIAKGFFFPRSTPEISRIADAKRPAWLRNGGGDDGYVRVDVSTSMPNKSCLAMGAAGFMGKIGAEAMQLSISVRIHNLFSSLQSREIPIAILDGRPNPGGCVILTVLDSAMTLVPMARLESAAGGVGKIRIEVLIRSTSDSKINIVGPAQAILGVASVFATGGAATTVAGLTSALAEPALKRIEAAIDSANSGVTPGLSSINISWDEVRSLEKLRVPVYFGATSGWTESEGTALNRLQADISTASRTPDFFVELDFHHFPTAFDLVAAPDGIPASKDISSSEILRHPGQIGVPNVAQLLDSGLSTLNKATTDADIVDGCKSVLATAKSAGFSLNDRAMILYSAMDKARPSGWYQRRDFTVCTSGNSAVAARIQRIYGTSSVEFSYADARSKQASGDELHTSWLSTGVPILDRLKKALTISSAAERERVISVLAGSLDIELDAPTGPSEWPLTTPSIDGSVVNLPNVKRLASTQLKAAGCFSYRNDQLFNANSAAGEMLLLDGNERLWVASVKLADGQASKISKVYVFEADDNWRRVYRGYIDAGLFGTPVKGACAGIAPKI